MAFCYSFFFAIKINFGFKSLFPVGFSNENSYENDGFILLVLRRIRFQNYVNIS